MKNKNKNLNELVDILRIEGINAKGFGVIPKIVMQDTRLTVESKSIYAYFASYAGSGNQAFPSRSLILKHLQMGETRYYKHFSLLKKFGYIEVYQEKRSGNKYGRNIFTLISHPVEVVDDKLPPHPQNSGTEKPYPQNECTQIEDTQNECTNSNSFKINNINNNNLSINKQNKKNKNDGSIDSKQKTPFMKDTTLELQELKSMLEDQINFLDLKEVHRDNADLIDDIEALIIDMWYSDTVKIKNDFKQQSIVRANLAKLTYYHIQELLERFSKLDIEIKNAGAYLKSMIYTIAIDNNLAITNAVQHLLLKDKAKSIEVDDNDYASELEERIESKILQEMKKNIG